MNDYIKLSPNDNVVVALRDFLPGETIEVLGNQVILIDTIFLGHKIAIKQIHVGENVVKYGFPIGHATQDIRIGEHVHSHNMRSDYFLE